MDSEGLNIIPPPPNIIPPPPNILEHQGSSSSDTQDSSFHELQILDAPGLEQSMSSGILKITGIVKNNFKNWNVLK